MHKLTPSGFSTKHGNMIWFSRKKRMEMIQSIRPTSKSSLKMQCLWACGADIKKAKELYDYFAADLPDLPDTDPVQPSWIDNTKLTVNGLMGWLKENQDTLANGYEFIRNVIANRGKLPTTITEEALPPIN